MKKLTVIVAIGFLALVGCATPQLDINELDPAAERLAEVAESILDLARIENDVMASRYLNDGGRVTAPIDTYHIPSVNRVISFGDNWIGPLFQIVDKLSVAGGLNPPRYLGVKPPGDVIVQVLIAGVCRKVFIILIKISLN